MDRPKVFSVAIETTAHCQQKCSYCYNAWREDNGAGFEAGTQAKMLARVDKLLTTLDVDHVTVTGGEPFARALLVVAAQAREALAHGAQAQREQRRGLDGQRAGAQHHEHAAEADRGRARAWQVKAAA